MNVVPCATQFPESGITYRKCSRTPILERQNILVNCVAATEFAGDKINCDTRSGENTKGKIRAAPEKWKGVSLKVISDPSEPENMQPKSSSIIMQKNIIL